MGEMIVAHDIRHGLKANQQIRADGLGRRDTVGAYALSEAGKREKDDWRHRRHPRW